MQQKVAPAVHGFEALMFGGKARRDLRRGQAKPFKGTGMMAGKIPDRPPPTVRLLLMAIMLRVLMTAIAWLALTSIRAADWPCWRGPDGAGISSEKNLPLHWSKEDGIAWKIVVPGKGASSPIVVGERIFVTTQTDDTALHV